MSKSESESDAEGGIKLSMTFRDSVRHSQLARRQRKKANLESNAGMSTEKDVNVPLHAEFMLDKAVR